MHVRACACVCLHVCTRSGTTPQHWPPGDLAGPGRCVSAGPCTREKRKGCFSLTQRHALDSAVVSRDPSFRGRPGLRLMKSGRATACRLFGVESEAGTGVAMKGGTERERPDGATARPRVSRAWRNSARPLLLTEKRDQIPLPPHTHRSSRCVPVRPGLTASDPALTSWRSVPRGEGWSGLLSPGLWPLVPRDTHL